MKIYTYYNDINFTNQHEILSLWQNSWNNNGFDAIILSEKDAQKHPYFNSFCQQLREVYKELKNELPKEYIMCCHVRWLAYATQKNEAFYVSDYDVINFKLKPKEPIDGLHFAMGYCPCFASGKPKDFEEFAKDIIEETKKNVNRIKKQSKVTYHDQEFIFCNRDFLQQKYTFSNEVPHNHIKHYHHGLAYLMKSKNIEEIRLDMIKNDLDIIKDFINEK